MTLVAQRALGTIAPPFVAQWVGLEWFLAETAAAYGAAFLQNLANAVRTGDFGGIFNVVSPAVAVAVRNGRNEARQGALVVPPNILALIPDKHDRDFVKESVRYATIRHIEDKRFFYVWEKFNDNASAITLIDTIIFVEPPDFQDYDDQFLFLHEIKHALQYKHLGLDAFVNQYLQQKMAGTDPVPFEREADLYACSILPYGRPHYIGACPLPSPSVTPRRSEKALEADADPETGDTEAVGLR